MPDAPETELFQHYRVLRREDGRLWELGRGAMGVTYKAVDTNLDAPVALKVINSLYLDSESARARFQREAKAAASLRHRNVASVYHLGHDAQSFFYAMEFVEGETVESLVARGGPQPWRTALHIILQVARALMAAHDKHLVHRDIKPANIMLVDEVDEVAVVKVIDFGLAKSVAEEGGSVAALSGSGFLGTPLFASPEQCDEIAPDIRSDIYSLGVTLWVLLTGKPLFTGSVGKVFSQHLHAPVPFEALPANVPEPVRALLTRMLAKEREDRPQTPLELRREIEACLQGQGGATVFPSDADAGATLTAPVYYPASDSSVPTVTPTRFPGAGSSVPPPPAHASSVPPPPAYAYASSAPPPPPAYASATPPPVPPAHASAVPPPPLLYSAPPPVAYSAPSASRRIALLVGIIAAVVLVLGALIIYSVLRLPAGRSGLAGGDSPAPVPTDAPASTVAPAYPTDGKSFTELFSAARDFTAWEEWHKAIDAYSSALEIEPDSTAALTERGCSYSSMGDTARARADYARVLRLPAVTPRERYYRGYAYQAMGRTQTAEVDFVAGMNMDTPDAYGFLLRGNTYAFLRNYSQAVRDYTEAIRLQPRWTVGYTNRAYAYVYQEKYDLALVDCNTALRQRPDSVTALCTRASVFAGQAAFEKAIADCNEAIRLTPRNAQPYAQRANIYGRQGKLDLALQDYDEVVSLDPKNRYSYVNRAQVRRALGQEQAAQADEAAAARLDTP